MAVVDYRVEDHIAIITLNRSEARNAINPEVAVRLAQAWAQVHDDDNVRAAIAGGMELVQGTDIRVSVPEARFGVQEVKWALFPAGGSTVRLPRQLPYSKAMELLLTGDLVSAEEALALGFLNYVVPADGLMAKSMEIARKIAANGLLAVKAIRQSARACLGRPEEEALRMELAYADPVLDPTLTPARYI